MKTIQAPVVGVRRYGTIGAQLTPGRAASTLKQVVLIAQTCTARWAVVAGLVGLAPVGQLHAQSTAPVVTPNAPPAPGQPPLVDPAIELTGAALVKALREGGFVMFMRHAHSAGPLPGCPGESALSPSGVAQSQAVGAALRLLKVPIALVQSSDFCRTRDTAELMAVGPVQLNSALQRGVLRGPALDYETRFGYLLQRPAAGGNLLLVSHVQPAEKKEHSIAIDYAEIVVYRWAGSGAATPVARIPQARWQTLIDLAANAR